MEFLNRLEALVKQAPAQIQHGALWLLGAVAAAGRWVHQLEASDPLVASAIKVGEAAAVSHGIPLMAIETAGEDLLKVAQAIAGQAPAPVPVPAATPAIGVPTLADGMKGVVGKTLALLLVVCLTGLVAACTSSGQLTPQGQQVIGALCQVDAAAQPVLVAVAPTLLPQTTPIASADNALVHPLVVAACAKVGGMPVGVQTAPAPVPAAVPVTAVPVIAAPAAPVAPAVTGQPKS